jgi:hypothetical protein
MAGRVQGVSNVSSLICNSLLPRGVERAQLYVQKLEQETLGYDCLFGYPYLGRT